MKIILISVVALSIIVVGAFIFMGIQSRDGKAPGMTEMRLSLCGVKPNCVASDTAPGSAAHISAFTFATGEEDAVWAKLIDVIVREGGELTDNVPPYLAATFTSKIFGFVDDFECLIDQDAGVLHVRAGARVGHSDFDVNRTRVERIRQLLTQ